MTIEAIGPAPFEVDGVTLASDEYLLSMEDGAIRLWYDDPDHFRHLMLNGMRYDYSWNHPGQNYLNIYEHIRHK